MNRNYENEKLKEEIEEKRSQLYKFIELDLNEDIILNYSQKLDLLINKYNELIKNNR